MNDNPENRSEISYKNVCGRSIWDTGHNDTKLDSKDRIRIIIMTVFIWLIISISMILLLYGAK